MTHKNWGSLPKLRGQGPILQGPWGLQARVSRSDQVLYALQSTLAPAPGEKLLAGKAGGLGESFWGLGESFVSLWGGGGGGSFFFFCGGGVLCLK